MLDVVVEKPGPETVTLRVRGELDCHTAARLRATITALLNNGGITSIELDAGEVTFLDSAGVGTLVVAGRISDAVGVRLRVTVASPIVTRVLTVTGVAEALGLPREPALTPAGA